MFPFHDNTCKEFTLLIVTYVAQEYKIGHTVGTKVIQVKWFD